MTTENILADPDLKKCVDFHGHICGGLALGYKASKAGLEWLREKKSLDEEIVAVVENNACCVDAVQVLTGCTFGKGNFIVKDHGKIVFTFFSRKTGEGIRIAMKPRSPEQKEKQKEQMEKMRGSTITEEERSNMMENMALGVLNAPVENLFDLKPVKIPPPGKAVIEESRACDQCGEPTMISKLEKIGGRNLCRECVEQ